MKKAIILMLLLVGATTLAQEKKERQHRGGMSDMSAEQMATLQTKKMALALDLSKEQQGQMQVLNLENAKARKAKMEKRKADKEEGERKKPNSEERYAMKNARLDAQLAQKEEMKKILSEEQITKWEKMKHGKKRSRHGKKGTKRNSKK